MDRAPEILKLLGERGPMTVRRIARLTKLPKRLINGALHGSKFTCKVETVPFNRPLWSVSDRPIRPKKQMAHLVLRPTLEKHEDENKQGK